MATIDGLPPLRAVIAAHDLVAKRQLGQNFLLDLNLTAKIARSAGDLTGADVLEVGPGPGGLTRGLLAEGARRVLAVEKDARCLPALAEVAAAYPGRLEVVQGDALEVDAAARLVPPVKVVANLPYNVGTELLIRWLTPPVWPPFWQSLTLMFQKEVAERIVARPGDDAYGRLALLAQWRCSAKIVMVLPPEAFTPAPKVHSAVVHLVALPEPRFPADAKVFGAGGGHGLQPAAQDVAVGVEGAWPGYRGQVAGRRDCADAARRGGRAGAVLCAGAGGGGLNRRLAANGGAGRSLRRVRSFGSGGIVAGNRGGVLGFARGARAARLGLGLGRRQWGHHPGVGVGLDRGRHRFGRGRQGGGLRCRLDRIGDRISDRARRIAAGILAPGPVFAAAVVALAPGLVGARLIGARLIGAGRIAARLVATRLIWAGAAGGVALAAIAAVATRLLLGLGRRAGRRFLPGLGRFHQTAVHLVRVGAKTEYRHRADIGLVIVAVIAARGIALAIAVAIAALRLRAALVLFGGHFAHRLAQHAGIVFGVLREVFGRHAVVRQLGIARQSLVFLDDLLRRSAHLAFGPELSNTRLTMFPMERGRFCLERERDLEDLMCPVFRPWYCPVPDPARGMKAPSWLQAGGNLELCGCQARGGETAPSSAEADKPRHARRGKRILPEFAGIGGFFPSKGSDITKAWPQSPGRGRPCRCGK
jgi:16S rRNA (adenine1518-N6/adenine1519-N6)-dimethyltransferase